MRGFLFCAIIYVGEIERKGATGSKLNARSDVTQVNATEVSSTLI